MTPQNRHPGKNAALIGTRPLATGPRECSATALLSSSPSATLHSFNKYLLSALFQAPGLQQGLRRQISRTKGAQPSFSALVLPKTLGGVKREARLGVSVVGLEGEKI